MVKALNLGYAFVDYVQSAITTTPIEVPFVRHSRRAFPPAAGDFPVGEPRRFYRFMIAGTKPV